MPPATAKTQRKESFASEGQPSQVFCMRCLSTLTDGLLKDKHELCIHSTETVLFRSFQGDGKKYQPCERCHNAGQDCFAVSIMGLIGAGCR